MSTYKWIKTGVSLQRIEDGAGIPVDTRNKDYQQFLADGGIATAEPPPLTQDQNAQATADSLGQLLLDVLFDQENRIRVLEGKAAITRAQYRTALIARWKVLNP